MLLVYNLLAFPPLNHVHLLTEKTKKMEGKEENIMLPQPRKIVLLEPVKGRFLFVEVTKEFKI